MDSPPRLICIGCGRTPAELECYTGFLLPGESPDAYVMAEEGTLNPINGHFACDVCWIRMGMPSRPSPEKWVAP